jgi:hypothetical protein
LKARRSYNSNFKVAYHKAITKDTGHLRAEGRAQTFTMLPESKMKFVATGSGERAEFDKNFNGAITGFTFTTGTGLGTGEQPTATAATSIVL